MKNKVLILLSAIALFSYSLSAQESNNFEIKFNISGVAHEGVYCTFFGERDNTGFNEKIEGGSGEFLFKGYVPAPTVVRVSFAGVDRFMKRAGRGILPVKSMGLWMIVYPGAKFIVEGDLNGKDFVDVYPKDGGENDIYAILTGKIMPLTNEGANNYLKIKFDQSTSDNEKAILEKKNAEIDKEIAKAKREFLDKYTSSLGALWLMEDMLIRSEIPVLDLEPYMAKVDVAKYGDNYYYKAVKSRIDGAKATAYGQICPSVITNNTPDGSTFNIESLRGKYLIIDFWGTWCGPCVAGIPHMKAFRDKHRDKVELLGISNDRDITMWRNYLIKNNMDYPNILIGKGEEDFVSKFNVQGFPTKILIDPNGKILYRESGESEEFYVKMEEMIK